MTLPDRNAPTPPGEDPAAPGAAVPPGDDPAAGAAASPPETLKKRREFLAAARARRWAAPGLVLQARRRRQDEAPGGPRVGYTCSKKVGGAVERNRAKRRLRAAAARVVPRRGRPGWDYVLIGRAGATTTRPFPDLVADLEAALDRVHRPAAERADRRPRQDGGA